MSNKYTTDYIEGYNYDFKYKWIESREDLHDSISNLLLYENVFIHVIRWYIEKIGITTKDECSDFFTKHLKDYEIHTHIKQIICIIHSFK